MSARQDGAWSSEGSRECLQGVCVTVHAASMWANIRQCDALRWRRTEGGSFPATRPYKDWDDRTDPEKGGFGECLPKNWPFFNLVRMVAKTFKNELFDKNKKFILTPFEYKQSIKITCLKNRTKDSQLFQTE